jgi:hypothetical protein
MNNYQTSTSKLNELLIWNNEYERNIKLETLNELKKTALEKIVYASEWHKTIESLMTYAPNEIKDLKDFEGYNATTYTQIKTYRAMLEYMQPYVELLRKIDPNSKTTGAIAQKYSEATQNYSTYSEWKNAWQHLSTGTGHYIGEIAREALDTNHKNESIQKQMQKMGYWEKDIKYQLENNTDYFRRGLIDFYPPNYIVQFQADEDLNQTLRKAKAYNIAGE